MPASYGGRFTAKGHADLQHLHARENTCAQETLFSSSFFHISTCCPRSSSTHRCGVRHCSLVPSIPGVKRAEHSCGRLSAQPCEPDARRASSASHALGWSEKILARIAIFFATKRPEAPFRRASHQYWNRRASHAETRIAPARPVATRCSGVASASETRFVSPPASPQHKGVIASRPFGRPVCGSMNTAPTSRFRTRASRCAHVGISPRNPSRRP